MIEKAYQTLKVDLDKPIETDEEANNSTASASSKMARIKSAYNCLKKSECRSEYTRFGSGIELNSSNDEFKFDWRLCFTVLFYLVFAFVQGTLA